MAGKGQPRTGGRVAGVPNKVTQEFRQTVTSLLEKNAANVDLWLQRVADGIPGDEDNKPIPPDPGKALDLLAKLAEYAAPKLNRTEVVGDKDRPVHQKVEMVIIDGTAR